MQPILTDKSVINLLPIASKIKPKSLHIYILQEMLLSVFRYGDHMVLIGNRKLMEDNNISVIETVDLTLNKFETQGKTAILAD
jgi:hypothetical protein